jgi:hypothetical protein
LAFFFSLFFSFVFFSSNGEARIALASLLVEEGKENEAISLLSPPKDSGTCKNVFFLCDQSSSMEIYTNGEVLADSGEAHSEKSNRWWVDVRIKLKLCNIFQIRGMLNDFVNVSLPLVHESLNVPAPRRKVIFEKLYLCIHSCSCFHTSTFTHKELNIDIRVVTNTCVHACSVQI